MVTEKLWRRCEGVYTLPFLDHCFIVLAFSWCKPDKRNTALTNKTKLYLSSNVF